MTLSLPEGACDCHVHVIGPQDTYPMLPGRRYTPGPAGVQALHGHLRRLGLSRAVIVQPSVYGVDNRLLEESLAQPRGAVRGVAVLGPEVDDGELARLHAAGVRGVRVNLENAGASDPDALARLLSAWAGRVRGQGWHLQVYASCRALAAAAPRVRKLGVPLVFDHFAMTPAQTAPDDHELRAILDLVREGAAYVKLSAPYRIGGPIPHRRPRRRGRGDGAGADLCRGQPRPPAVGERLASHQPRPRRRAARSEPLPRRAARAPAGGNRRLAARRRPAPARAGRQPGPALRILSSRRFPTQSVKPPSGCRTSRPSRAPRPGAPPCCPWRRARPGAGAISAPLERRPRTAR